MARTPQARSIAVVEAVQALPDATATAIEALGSYGPDDDRTLAAWEAVERLGATVHRQSRLLAGKSRGG